MEMKMGKQVYVQYQQTVAIKEEIKHCPITFSLGNNSIKVQVALMVFPWKTSTRKVQKMLDNIGSLILKIQIPRGPQIVIAMKTINICNKYPNQVQMQVEKPILLSYLQKWSGQADQ